MKIEEDLRHMCALRAFEWCAKVKFNFTLNEFESQEKIDISDDCIAKIRELFVGKNVKNPIEHEINFQNEEEIRNYFKDIVEIRYQRIDKNSRAKKTTIPVEIIYANYEQISNHLSSITKLKVKSVIGEFHEEKEE